VNALVFDLVNFTKKEQNGEENKRDQSEKKPK